MQRGARLAVEDCRTAMWHLSRYVTKSIVERLACKWALVGVSRLHSKDNESEMDNLDVPQRSVKGQRTNSAVGNFT